MRVHPRPAALASNTIRAEDIVGATVHATSIALGEARPSQIVTSPVAVADRLEGALRRHMAGGFSWRGVAEALVAEGWSYPGAVINIGANHTVTLHGRRSA